MNKFASFAAMVVLPVLGVLFTTPVFADSPGQLSNGPSNYKVRNVTQNGAYAQSVAATCNETVKYSITLSNSDYGLLRNLMVTANPATGAISASATNAADQTTSVAGSATVTVDKGTLKYVAGSTVRITSDGKTITPLADGIVSGGVNAGDLNGSTAIFVQFQAKVDCPPVEQPKNIQVCDLASKTVITIREDQFDAKKHSKNLDDCKEVVKHIQVCELATKKVVTIDEKNFDSKKYSKNLADCAEKPPLPGEIVVCKLDDKSVVTIKENMFDSSKHSKDLSKCAPAPFTPVTPVTPAELPKTGATGMLTVAATLLTAGIGYVVTARKNLLG